MCKKVSEFVPLCHCQTPGHDGEPVEQQIRDPFTGDVHAPGLIVKEDGSIEKVVKPYE